MKIVRPLIYKEKMLDDFDIDNDKSVFKIFFDVLLTMDGTRVTDVNVEDNITGMFNDACYICNVVIQIKRPYLHYGMFKEIASRDTNGGYYYPTSTRVNVVMSMVYFLLEEHGDNSADLTRFKRILSKDLKENSIESRECFERLETAYEGSGPTYLSGDFVVKQPIKSEDLRKINWAVISENYNKQSLKEIVCFWNDPEDRNLIIDDIEKELNGNVEEELPF